MLAQFSIVPLDKGVSVGNEVAKVLQIIDNSGLLYKLNPMGTIDDRKGMKDRIEGKMKSLEQRLNKSLRK